MATFSVTNTNDSGTGSLRQAIIEANALTGKDFISFDGVFTDNIADTITLAGSSLYITDDLSIDGKGTDLLTVSANDESRVFEINSNVTVEIEGLSVGSANSSGAGGAILNSGNLTLSNINFVGYTYASYGGGIYNSGTLTLSNSTIGEQGAVFGGGGIYNTGIATVSNSTITNSLNGSGIYNEGRLTVSNTTISYNYATEGSGIYNTGTLTVSDSTITSNESTDGGGGGIYNTGTLTVSNTTISNNYVYDSGFSTAEGGGIYNTGTLTVSDSTISGNQALQGTGIYNAGTLEVSNSIISDNDQYAEEAVGGGIYNSGSATISYSTISRNSADRGGGIYNDNSGTLILSYSTISSNGSISGGGIYNNGIAIVSNSTISDNRAYDYIFDSGAGGGIFNSGTITVTNSTISGNTTQQGGGIYNRGTATVSNSTISGNIAKLEGSPIFDYYYGSSDYAGGGGIYNLGTLVVGNSTITLNTSYDYTYDEYGYLISADIYTYGNGGGIYNGSSGSATVNNSIVAGNNYDATNVTSRLDVVGNFTSNGFNLINVLNGSTGFDTSEELYVPITEVIDIVLRDNGGPVKTHALVTGSIAINGGDNADVPIDTTDLDGDGNTTEEVPYDQRGSGFARISGGRVDIGAYEAQVKVIKGKSSSDCIKGTAGNDIIIGYAGKDYLRGGDGADAFVYTSIKDAGDTIADFKAGTDKIVLRELFQSYGLELDLNSAIASGYLSFKTQGNNTVILIDPDGSSGSGSAVSYITVKNISVVNLNKAINFAF